MPLTGDYEPSTSSWARTNAEVYEATNGEEGGDLRGRPVIVLTSVGARTGKLRKTALMRVEHDGVYAVVASLGGSPQEPRLVLQPQEEPRTSNCRTSHEARLHGARGHGRREGRLVGARRRDLAGLRELPGQKTDRQIPVFVLDPIDQSAL
jgi:deazaflavin-dependent oxidoreductase (nitroreductase family)